VLNDILKVEANWPRQSSISPILVHVKLMQQCS
jgi:hypothetical protein